MKIKDDVLKVLVKSTVDETANLLFLPPQQLERKLYTDVNKCLESIGGAWNRKAKAHVFDHNPSDDLDEMINTGEWTDKKKEYQFFETPVELAKRMMDLAEINPTDFLLEPSAGQGRISDQFPKGNKYTLIELNPDNYNILFEKYEHDRVNQMDFLSFTGKYDKIIMNPPFAKQQDVKHIFHAWDCLAKGGRLVSIVSESPFFRENNLSKKFREWLDSSNAEVIDLDSGTFKESGTMVKTRLIVVDKKEN